MCTHIYIYNSLQNNSSSFRIQAHLSLRTILLLKFFLEFRGGNCNTGKLSKSFEFATSQDANSGILVPYYILSPNIYLGEKLI